SVEVRQDSTGAIGGQVGIYFQHSMHTDPQARRVHCFCGLAYGELNIAQRTPRYVALISERYCPLGPQNASRSMLFASTQIPSFNSPTDPGRWRKLTVDVSPGEVRAYWAAQKNGDTWATTNVGTLPREQIERTVASIKARPNYSPDPLLEVYPTFAPREALGLFVYRASASFRRAVLEPRGEAD